MSDLEKENADSEQDVGTQNIRRICASCKKIRNDEGSWGYITDNADDASNVLLSHGICPQCVLAIYPWFEQGNSISLK